MRADSKACLNLSWPISEPIPTPFWEKPLAALDRGEWEALCDGCGRCCLHKLEDEETGQLYPTNVACKLLDRAQRPVHRLCAPQASGSPIASCSTASSSASSTGCPRPAPTGCARRASRCREWHYLISGSRETVHEAGQSTRGWTVSEADAGELEDHVVDRSL